MLSNGHRSLPSLLPAPRRFCLPVLFALSLLQSFATEVGDAKGIVFTVASDNVQVLWPNARITLKDGSNGQEVSTVSNGLGAYSFTGIRVGDYEITVSLAGFEPGVKRLTIVGGKTAQIDFQLTLQRQKNSIQVSSEVTRVDLTSSSAAPTLTAEVLKSVVQLNQNFQDALPLLPGVVRGLDGELHIKGGRSNQTSTLVNTASVADPFTGQPALRLPAIAVQSVRVLSNPFSAEYGKFGSGVVEVNTRGGTDKWKVLFEDPIPRFRWINGRVHGVESASPHLTFAGPLQRGKVYIFQSLLHGYDTVRVPSLPDPDNVRVQENATSYTQIDWNPSPNQRFTAVLTIDPQLTKFANINTFNPQPVTADYRQRGFFTSLTHRWIFSNGGFLQSMFSAKRFDARVYPANSDVKEMVFYPEQNSGTYFEQQQRRTRLYQGSQTLHIWPIESAAGRHLLTFGYSFARSTYGGQVGNIPVRVLREDHSLSSSISYGPTLNSNASKNELSLFAQDSWQIASRFTVDLGARLDHDSLSAESVNVAPRIGFVFAPTRDNRTAIRGGFGVFFDKIPLNVSIFPQLPPQTITSYADDGTTSLSGPVTFVHVFANTELRVPYSIGWTLQLDREVRSDLLLRVGVENRKGYRAFYLDSHQAPGGSELRLFNRGHETYREFLAMIRWRPTERTIVYVSYIRSASSGELNDYNQFFGNFSTPLIRPNQYGRVSSDAPDRGIVWGVVPLPHKLDFIPVLDIHTGFPYSRLDQNWNYIGQENGAGRFPTFVGFDTKFQYPVDFTFRKHRIQFRAGLSILNVLGHFNPRDVQQYGPSPNYGSFYNSVGRLFRIDGYFDF